MLTPGYISHTCEFGLSIQQVCVDALPVRQVECDSPEDLFQTEGRERFDDAFRRFAPQEGIYDGVKGNSAPGNVISAFALFNVFLSPWSPVYSIGRPAVPRKKVKYSLAGQVLTA